MKLEAVVLNIRLTKLRESWSVILVSFSITASRISGILKNNLESAGELPSAGSFSDMCDISLSVKVRVCLCVLGR